MKKWRWIGLEAVVLVVLVVAACLICANLNQDAAPTLATDSAETAVSQQSETEPTATEPPPEPVVATWATMPEDYQLSSREYFVYDVTADAFITASGDPATTQVYPASITKLFTIQVALRYLEPDTSVVVGAEITMIDPDSTTASLQQGDVLTVQELVGGMLLPSGNDAAYVLAAAAGRAILEDPDCSAWTAVDAFVKEMNHQAQVLGMTGSHFCNPDGIHNDDHYLTLADMALLGKMSLESPVVMDYAGTGIETVCIGDRSVTWKNTNMLVRSDIPLMSDEELNLSSDVDPELWRQLYCEYAVGLKTGRTTPAGCCLLSAFEVQGRQLIIGVYGCPDGEYRFTDTLHLLNEALNIA